MTLLIWSTGVLLGLALIKNWYWKQSIQGLWKRGQATIPPGQFPSKAAQVGSLLLLGILWILTSWAWILASQPSQAPAVVESSLFDSTVNQQLRQIVFLVDTSRSMLVPDSWQQRTRLEQAKDIVDAVIAKLQGEHVVLFEFAAQPVQLVPSTPDHFFVRLINRQLNVSEKGSGTDLIQVLFEIRDRYGEKARRLAAQTLVVLLSDGGDTEWEQMTDEKKEAQKQALANLFQNLNRFPVQLITVGIGSLKGGTVPGVTFEGKPVHSELQELLMRLIGQMGRGGYVEGNQNADEVADQLINKLRDLGSTSMAPKSSDQAVAIPMDSSWRMPLFLALTLLVIHLLFPLAQRYPFTSDSKNEQ